MLDVVDGVYHDLGGENPVELSPCCMKCANGSRVVLPIVGMVGGVVSIVGLLLYGRDEAFNWGHTGVQISDARLNAEYGMFVGGLATASTAVAGSAVAETAARCSACCFKNICSHCCDTRAAEACCLQFGKWQCPITLMTTGVGFAAPFLGKTSSNSSSNDNGNANNNNALVQHLNSQHPFIPSFALEHAIYIQDSVPFESVFVPLLPEAVSLDIPAPVLSSTGPLGPPPVDETMESETVYDIPEHHADDASPVRRRPIDILREQIAAD